MTRVRVGVGAKRTFHQGGWWKKNKVKLSAPRSPSIFRLPKAHQDEWFKFSDINHFWPKGYIHIYKSRYPYVGCNFVDEMSARQMWAVNKMCAEAIWKFFDSSEVSFSREFIQYSFLNGLLYRNASINHLVSVFPVHQDTCLFIFKFVFSSTVYVITRLPKLLPSGTVDGRLNRVKRFCKWRLFTKSEKKKKISIISLEIYV